jgi:hypothetical protein
MKYDDAITRVYEADSDGVAIDDETARCIAAQWHSPSVHDWHITALSHGRFDALDLDGLRDEVMRERGALGAFGSDYDALSALLVWADARESDE